MFIGRERELATLNKLYASDKFEFVVIYGRRRVGKTALISQFIDDKNAIYFMGVESNAKQNLENFSKSIMSYHTGMMPKPLSCPFRRLWNMCSSSLKKNGPFSQSTNTLMLPVRRKVSLPPFSF